MKFIQQWSTTIALAAIGLFVLSIAITASLPAAPPPVPTAAVELRPTFAAATATPFPTLQPAATIAPRQAEHVVQSGESLALIAEQYCITWEELAEFNGLVDPNRLEIGQVLKIPSTC